MPRSIGAADDAAPPRRNLGQAEMESSHSDCRDPFARSAQLAIYQAIVRPRGRIFSYVTSAFRIRTSGFWFSEG